MKWNNLKIEYYYYYQQGQLSLTQLYYKQLFNLWVDNLPVNSISTKNFLLINYLAGYVGKELLEIYHKRGSDINQKSELDETPLVYACYFDREDTVEYLVENNAELNIITKNNSTPLDHVNYDIIKNYLRYKGARKYKELIANI